MRAFFKRSGWMIALLFLLASLGSPVASAAKEPVADQHSLVVEHGTGRVYRVAHNSHAGPYTAGSPYGLSPATVKSIYNFPAGNTLGTGKTIAIVDAYDDPTAESDLGVFSRQYGLPSCTTKNGCFKKVNQSGSRFLPQADSGWALEISLDVQWAHAIAPGAKILLVEANSNGYGDLFAAVDYARNNADYVSLSWGSGEFNGESYYDSYLSPTSKRPNVSFFVSSGDGGAPSGYPSASPNVISVGGTTLNFDTNKQFTTETGWSGSGGGCSQYEAANAAQASYLSSTGPCGSMRAAPDVSLDADPASGVSVYDSTPYNGSTGWWAVGGTSASSPMWAARAAITGQQVNAAYVYGNNITYRDITSGSNGNANNAGFACLPGYDLVTGRGSWTH